MCALFHHEQQISNLWSPGRATLKGNPMKPAHAFLVASAMLCLKPACAADYAAYENSIADLFRSSPMRYPPNEMSSIIEFGEFHCQMRQQDANWPRDANASAPKVRAALKEDISKYPSERGMFEAAAIQEANKYICP
jgi:hypothetical protein